MIKEELEKLIDGKPDDVKSKGIRLFNAHLKTSITYTENPSAQNLKNMQAAEEALKEFRRAIQTEKSVDTLETVSAVVKYLEESGWKISEKTLYRHINKDRKLLRRPDGTFDKKDVDKYAAAYLKQAATGRRQQNYIDQIQRDKLEQELKNLKLKNEKEQFLYDKEKGLYIPRIQMDIELAARAGVLLAGLKHWIQANAAEWINLSGGDMHKVGELINKMTNDLDDHINHYAGSREYEVVIEADTEPEASPENENAENEA